MAGDKRREHPAGTFIVFEQEKMVVRIWGGQEAEPLNTYRLGGKADRMC